MTRKKKAKLPNNPSNKNIQEKLPRKSHQTELIFCYLYPYT